jgi:hypothetical protein
MHTRRDETRGPPHSPPPPNTHTHTHTHTQLVCNAPPRVCSQVEVLRRPELAGLPLALRQVRAARARACVCVCVCVCVRARVRVCVSARRAPQLVLLWRAN